MRQKKSLVYIESIVAKLVRYFIFTSVYKTHNTETGYIQQVVYNFKISVAIFNLC